MKKITIVIIVALLILLIPYNVDVFAQEPTTVATSAAKIEYTLPYPGILPDHPLWFLKALRDRVIEFLIADPFKKAEFHLLTADKRLQAGVSLLQKGKQELSLSTISKGENYFEMAISQATLAKDRGQGVKMLLEKLKKAVKKHKEVLQEVREKMRGDLVLRTEKELERVQSFEKTVENLSK